MDLLNMTKRAQIHEFYKKVKYRKFIFLKLELSNFVANWQNKSYGQKQNFSPIPLKLCQLRQKNTVTSGVNYSVIQLKI